MVEHLHESASRLLRLVGPEPDGPQRAMERHADEASFPIIGPMVGGLLAAVARLTDAERVFELGSGFGYSASWFARGMRRGQVVLTEVDADELDLAREYLGGADYAPSFRYEHGDGMAAVGDYAGPFDLVLIDHDKPQYVTGFEAVREKVAPGGAVVADNMLAGLHDVDDVLAGLEGEQTHEHAAGIARYLERVRDDAAFETVVLPVGEGVALSVRRR